MDQRIKLYLDEDTQSTDLVQALRARNVDILTVSEAELLGQPDEVQLQFATEKERVIVSFNRGDFFQIHTEWLKSEQHHTGIIVSDQLGVGVVTRRLLKLLDEKSAEEMKDWFEFLSNWQ